MVITDVMFGKSDRSVPVALVKFGDRDTTAIRIVIDRYSADIDLSVLGWAIKLSNGENTDIVSFTPEVKESTLEYSFTLPAIVASAPGICEIELEGVNTELNMVWQSGTRTIKVLDDLDAEPGYDPDDLSIFQQTIMETTVHLNDINSQMDGFEGRISEAVSNAEEATADALTAAEKAEDAVTRAETALDNSDKIVAAAEKATEAATSAATAATSAASSARTATDSANTAASKAQSIADTVERKLAAGELTGPQGERGLTGKTGAQGDPGQSIYHQWQGTTLVLTSASGTNRVNLQGPKGDPGESIVGPKGEPGIQGPAGRDGVNGRDGRDGSDASVTKENIKTALGYKPADESETATSADLARVEKTVDRNETNIDTLEKLWDIYGDFAEGDKTVIDGAVKASVLSYGGKSVVWNQLIFNGGPFYNTNEFVNVSSVLSVNNGKLIISDNNNINLFGFRYNLPFVNGHKYCVYLDADFSQYPDYVGIPSITIRNSSDIQTLPQKTLIVFTATIDADYIRYNFNSYESVSNKGYISVSCFNVVDLTQMFGAGNEPTSVDDPRIAWIESYAEKHPEYNTGEIVSADVESVTALGKNLCFKVINNANIGSDGKITGNTSFNLWCAPVTKGETYCLPQRVTSTSALYCCIYDDVPIFNSIGLIPRFVINNDRTFTASESGYAAIRVGLENTEPLIELGTISTSYAPYREPIIRTIPESVRNLDGYGWSVGMAKNYLEQTDDGRWLWHKCVNRVDLGDTPRWDAAGEGTPVAYYTGIGIVSDAVVYESATTVNPVLCGSYMTRKLSISAGYDKGIAISYVGNNNDNVVRIYDDSFKNLADFESAISGTMIYYILAEPVVTDVTDLMGDALREFTVESGGSITFDNDAGLSVPNTVQYKVIPKHTDVQINGTSITQDGVANIPNLLRLNENGKISVVDAPTSTKWTGNIGILNDGTITLANATKALVDARNSGSSRFVSLGILDYAVKASLTDGKNVFSDTEKALACETLGLSGYKLLLHQTFEENANSFIFDKDSEGNAFNLKSMLVIFDRIGDGESASVAASPLFRVIGKDKSSFNMKSGYFTMAGSLGNCWYSICEIDGEAIVVDGGAMPNGTNSQINNGWMSNSLGKVMNWQSAPESKLPFKSIVRFYKDVMSAPCITKGSQIWIYGKVI